MQKVLVPFDGSENVKRALKYLVEFSRVYPGLEVHVLNVQSAPVLYGDYITREMVEQMTTSALQHSADVNNEAAEILQAANVRHQIHQSTGEVVKEVAKAVKALGCDTVVMGTRGMSNLSNLLMGSVASRVVHEVSVPVLLVK
jgi:nucleotide-binding universal stress UspA family protein